MLIIINWFLCFYLFFIGFLSFVLIRKHLLSILLRLEFIALSLFILLVVFLKILNFESYLLISFIVFIVCEGSLGISILVSLVRTHGNDYISRFRIFQC